MTIGEIARLFNEHVGIGADVEVIAMEGWTRETYWDGTGLTSIISSPNIPTFDTTTVYPGAVLFEGTNVSEGRGTTRPFELIGAPWVIAERFADEQARATRRVLPPGALRADLPQARQAGLRRLSDPHPRSLDVLPGRGRRRADRSVPQHLRNSSRGSRRPTSTNTTRCRSTASRARRFCANKSKAAFRRAKSPGAGSRASTPSSRRARRSSCTDMSGAARRSRDTLATCMRFARGPVLRTRFAF